MCGLSWEQRRGMFLSSPYSPAARRARKPRRSAALPGDVLATLFYVANWRSVASGNDYFAAFTNERRPQ